MFLLRHFFEIFTFKREDVTTGETVSRLHFSTLVGALRGRNAFLIMDHYTAVMLLMGGRGGGAGNGDLSLARDSTRGLNSMALPGSGGTSSRHEYK